ncbi:MAG TPA: MotA/TolQ/ExbB proton channel family protein [bacterium]|jgi:biopolymer transport protein ExbB/TolQ
MDQQTFSIANWWIQGGIVMYPLAIYSVLGLAVLIEKFTFLRKIDGDSTEFIRGAIDKLKTGVDEPVTGDSIIAVILNRLRDLYSEGMKPDALIRTAEREVARVDDLAMRGMIWLAIIGNTAPFVGLFGTVVGIIRAFHGLSSEGLLTDPSGNPELIRGISEALVATATGLLVAVPAVIFYNFLLREIRSRGTRMELGCSDYIDALVAFGGRDK